MLLVPVVGLEAAHHRLDVGHEGVHLGDVLWNLRQIDAAAVVRMADIFTIVDGACSLVELA